MAIKSFMDLEVWRLAHETVLAIYPVARGFPDDERYALSQQMRRAATSIPANIAEGFGRRTEADRRQFYVVSRGSVEELRYYLILALDLRYLKDPAPLMERVDRIGAMLYRMIERLS
ncbi:MAG TPA: four helix bundle protein [Planctomycetota bacterium]